MFVVRHSHSARCACVSTELHHERRGRGDAQRRHTDVLRALSLCTVARGGARTHDGTHDNVDTMSRVPRLVLYRSHIRTFRYLGIPNCLTSERPRGFRQIDRARAPPRAAAAPRPSGRAELGQLGAAGTCAQHLDLRRAPTQRRAQPVPVSRARRAARVTADTEIGETSLPIS